MTGISIGGNNNAPIQNVTGENVSHVHQSVQTAGPTVEEVRELLGAFRRSVAQNAGELDNLGEIRAAANEIEAGLDDPVANAQGLRGAARMLPTLVATTALAEIGAALSTGIGALIG